MNRRLEAIEMWFYRGMMRFMCTVKRTNQEVLQMVEVTRELVTVARKKQFGILGKLWRDVSVLHDDEEMSERTTKNTHMEIIKELIGCERSSDEMRLAQDRSTTGEKVL